MSPMANSLLRMQAVDLEEGEQGLLETSKQ
jgi:hypothetical protein